MSALKVFDGWSLDVSEQDDPRVRDVDVAARAGMKRPRDIRAVIDRNRAELTAHGEIRVCALEPRGRGPEPRGSSGREYWLNEGQVTALVALLKTPAAMAMRIALVKLFIAWRRGQAPPASMPPGTAPAQARISDDPRARTALQAWCRTAAKASGRTIQSIQGELRKPWGVASLYRVPLVALDHTLNVLQGITVAGPVRRLPADRRQLSMWGPS